MFSEENNLSSIKIIDFGLSAQHFNYLTNNEYCGTFIYMAPEQIEKKLYHFSVDIWSIGILMFMLLNNGKHPFYQKNDKKEDFIKKIKIGKLNFINKLSFMAKHLNQKLCEVNPSWRYSAHLANKHPWITRNPNDEIPLTFNEILNRTNSKKNGSYLLMISIFLNHYKKKEIQIKEKEKEKDNNYYMDNFIKKKKNKIYYITKKYVNKCNMINEKQNQKNLRRKKKCLEVVRTDEEDSIERRQSISKNKNKRPSLKKHVRFSEDINTNKKKH
jgi:serine/threonine protein kinase